ncbi:hypothetical protein J6590_013140 [Homalodisca vitripennis]|nr:hypothetical protein J6590_013140 [Homalodisca vitripennis]
MILNYSGITLNDVFNNLLRAAMSDHAMGLTASVVDNLQNPPLYVSINHAASQAYCYSDEMREAERRRQRGGCGNEECINQCRVKKCKSGNVAHSSSIQLTSSLVSRQPRFVT